MEEQLHVHGFVGVFRETSRVIVSRGKTFSLIALFLILPFSYFFVDGRESSLFFSMVSPYVANRVGMFPADGPFWVFSIVRFFCVPILDLMGNAATAGTVASFYAGEHKASLQKIMTGVFQNMRKQPVFTYSWTVAIVTSYSDPFHTLFWVVLLVKTFVRWGVLLVMLLLFVKFTAFTFALWRYHLTTLISVLENDFSWDTMDVSCTKVQGKLKITVLTFFMFQASIQLISLLLSYFTIKEEGSKGIKIGVGVACVLLRAVVMLVRHVAYAVIYFACKSRPSDVRASLLEDHHVEESSVSTRIEAFDSLIRPLLS